MTDQPGQPIEPEPTSSQPMNSDDKGIHELAAKIAARRASISDFVRRMRPRSTRLANVSIVSSAVAAALTAGPAMGGQTFSETVRNGLSLSQDSTVWRTLCIGALIVSLVAAISANLMKSQDLIARLSAAEACNAELEGLQTLLEFQQLPLKDAVSLYRQYIAKIPFVEEADPMTLGPRE